MNPIEFRSIVQLAADACKAKNARVFASLFARDGELILPGHHYQGKVAIEKATAAYLASCQEIKIEIHRVLVEGTRAVVEWSWLATKVTGEREQSDNAIAIDFRSGLITRWREYTDNLSRNF